MKDSTKPNLTCVLSKGSWMDWKPKSRRALVSLLSSWGLGKRRTKIESASWSRSSRRPERRLDRKSEVWNLYFNKALSKRD